MEDMHEDLSVGIESDKIDIEKEIEDLITSGSDRLSQIFTLSKSKLTAAEIAQELDINASAVYGYQAKADGALYGRIPTAATLIKPVAGSIRSLLRRADKAEDITLSDSARARLESHADLIAAQADTIEPTAAIAAEDAAEITELNEVANLHGTPGIYAFSYRNYINHALDEHQIGDNRVLIKVGCGGDIGGRLDEHRKGARAHIPEPLVTLRAWRVGSNNPATEHLITRAQLAGKSTNPVFVVEKIFHSMLNAAGHDNPRHKSGARATGGNEVGSEWFLTTIELLDTIANTLGLDTVYAAD